MGDRPADHHLGGTTADHTSHLVPRLLCSMEIAARRSDCERPNHLGPACQALACLMTQSHDGGPRKQRELCIKVPSSARIGHVPWGKATFNRCGAKDRIRDPSLAHMLFEALVRPAELEDVAHILMVQILAGAEAFARVRIDRPELIYGRGASGVVLALVRIARFRANKHELNF